MKLLRKSVLNTQVATQRREQINEGVTLAQKVDGLRQKLGNLEEQERIYLAGMRKRLEETTEGLQEGIDAKKLELVEIEKERQRLLTPLDEEWTKVKNREREIVLKLGALDVKENRLDASQKRLDMKLVKAKESLGKIKVCERELEKTCQSANDLEAEALKNRDETLEEREKEHQLLDVRKAQLDGQEARNIQENESNVLFKDLLDMREKEVRDREILIKDREDTLARELKRRNG